VPGRRPHTLLALNEPSPAPTETRPSLLDLRPIAAIDQVVAKALEDMGLGSATVSTTDSGHSSMVDFSVLHFLIMPKHSVWLDLMLETDRSSALKIFEVFSGIAGAADEDLEDVLRETMNLIHGSLKVGFREAGVDLIIPVVPQSIAPDKIIGTTASSCLHLHRIFGFPGISLRFNLIARVAPVTRKELKKFRLAEVLMEPIAPEGDGMPEIVKTHTMLNRRLLDKVRDMAENDDRPHAVIEPSPLAELLPHD